MFLFVDLQQIATAKLVPGATHKHTHTHTHAQVFAYGQVYIELWGVNGRPKVTMLPDCRYAGSW